MTRHDREDFSAASSALAASSSALTELIRGRDRNNLKALTGPTEILPGTFGGVLTPPASANGTVFVAALNAPDTLYPDQTEYFGGKTGTMPGQVVAIDARTGP